MPKSLTVRDLPDEVMAELSSRAALAGKSLQEFMRGEITAMAAKPSLQQWMSRVQDRKDATGATMSTASILEYRSSDRP